MKPKAAIWIAFLPVHLLFVAGFVGAIVLMIRHADNPSYKLLWFWIFIWAVAWRGFHKVLFE